MGVPKVLYYLNTWPFLVFQWKAAHSDSESLGDYWQCTMASLKRHTIVLLWSHLNSRPPVVNIQALFSLATHLSKPPPPTLTQRIYPINPSRNVALVMERMPNVCPAGAAALKRTGACRSASPAWTVDSSTASRRGTVPPPAMLCVVTVCQGRKTKRYQHRCVTDIN